MHPIAAEPQPGSAAHRLRTPPSRIRPSCRCRPQSERKMSRSRLPRRFPRRPLRRRATPPNRVATGTGTAAESTLRVDVTLLNRMMNLVGELVLTRNQVLQATSADPNMTLLSRRLDMVTADLRESVMKARMQPVSNIFSKMPRIVRDLSQSLGPPRAAADGGPGNGTGQEPAGGHQGPADACGKKLARSRHRAARCAPGCGQGSGGNAQAAGQPGRQPRGHRGFRRRRRHCCREGAPEGHRARSDYARSAPRNWASASCCNWSFCPGFQPPRP